MTPVKLEALVEGSPDDISADLPLPLNCMTPVEPLQNHFCAQGKKDFVVFTDRVKYKPSKTFEYGFENKVNVSSRVITYLRSAGEFFLVYGKKLKPMVRDACYSFQTFSQKILGSNYTKYPSVQEVVDCIEKYPVERGDISVRASSLGLGSEKTATALPTEITEFYNTTVKPFIESQTEVPTTIGSPYANNPNTTFKAPSGISSESPESSNGMNYTDIGMGIGSLVGMIAVATTVVCIRKYKKKQYIKECRDMFTSGIEKQLVNPSTNNGLIPLNPIV